MTTQPDPYAGKPGHYFQNVRTEIRTLVPAGCDRVLELGCGSGATLDWVKRTFGCSETVGIELFPEAAEIAATRVDRVIVGDVERMELDLPPGHFDLILCMDVLEHLTDPWRVLRSLTPLLRPGGRVIASIPNVRNWSVLLPLLVSGRWEYQDWGILDRTHLRFFTYRSAMALMEQGGLKARAVHRLPLTSRSTARYVHFATFGLLRHLLTRQYMIAADLH